VKGLILYRSHYGNTKQVSDMVAQQLQALGHQVIVQDVRQKLPELQEFGFVFVGSPTRFGGPSGQAKSALKKLKKKGWGQKPVVIFDTLAIIPTNPEELEKSKKYIFPGAAGILQNMAKEQGLNVYAETLRCEVNSAKGPLVEGWAEKVAEFTKKFVETKINKK